MKLNEYQDKAVPFCVPQSDDIIDKTILVLGISGEASEVAEKWKKILAYKNSVLSEEDRLELGKEMGDVMWYIAVLAERLGLSLEELAKQNIKKLESREKRGVIKGSGDNR